MCGKNIMRQFGMNSRMLHESDLVSIGTEVQYDPLVLWLISFIHLLFFIMIWKHEITISRTWRNIMSDQA